MHLPRAHLAQLYTHLQRTTHPLSPAVLILTALNVDALCATRILASLLKRDYIPHKIQPVAGYAELRDAGRELVMPLTRQRGGEGGVVVCLGVGGLVDLEEMLGLDGAADGTDELVDMSEHGVEVWLVDSRRPWNLSNVFGVGAGVMDQSADGAGKRQGVEQGRVLTNYRPGKGGIIVWDDGAIEDELATEREAFMSLLDMPEITEDDLAVEAGESEAGSDRDEPSSSQGRKRKAATRDSDEDDTGNEDEERPARRRRSSSTSHVPSSPRVPISGQVFRSTPPTSSQTHSPTAVIPSSPPKQPSAHSLRRKLLKLRRKHEATLEAYYNLGTSYAEPISSMLYSLASDLGREDNDLLWLAVVGISSLDLSPFSQPRPNRDADGRRIMDRSEQIREVLRDEVRRLNPVPEAELRRSQSQGDVIPTYARSPTDCSIRLSPEPRFMLIRHWSLYDSMLHSPYLSTRLHIWSDAGRQRLHKLLAKMGVSLQEAAKSYVHMDMELKQSLRRRVLRFAPQYNLDGLVPGEDGRRGLEGWGFVRSWGWKATLSAVDVAIVAGAILEVGPDAHALPDPKMDAGARDPGYSARVQTLPTPPHSTDGLEQAAAGGEPDWTTNRFFAAYDALSPASSASARHGPGAVLAHIPAAQHLARAVLRCGAALMAKRQIRHLRAFRMAVVKEGPDAPLFAHPGALVKLAAWVAEAVRVVEAEKGRRSSGAARADEALVLACADESRGVFVVVGLCGGGAAGGRVKTKAQIREREARRKRRDAERAAEKAERARKREERRRLRRERDAANGLLESDGEGEESSATESEGESSSSGGGSDDDDSEEEGVLQARKRKGYGLNRFGQAFQEVVEETAARVRIDSFEHSVVEVKKEDLSGFLEALSAKSVVG